MNHLNQLLNPRREPWEPLIRSGWRQAPRVSWRGDNLAGPSPSTSLVEPVLTPSGSQGLSCRYPVSVWRDRELAICVELPCGGLKCCEWKQLREPLGNRPVLGLRSRKTATEQFTLLMGRRGINRLWQRAFIFPQYFNFYLLKGFQDQRKQLRESNLYKILFDLTLDL